MRLDNKYIARSALYIFIFSINFEVFDLLGSESGFSVGKLTGLLYFFVLIFSRIRFSLKCVTGLVYLLIAFVFLLAISSVLNLNYLSSKIIDFSLLQNIILFFALLVHEKNDSGVLMKSLNAFVLGCIFFSILFMFNVGVAYEGGRLTVFGDNSNAIGLRMAISVGFILYNVFVLNATILFKRIFLLVLVPILVFVMLETGSRKSFISLVFIVLFMVLMYFSLSPSRNFLKTIMYSFFGFIFLMLFFKSNQLLLDRLISSRDDGLGGREDIWLTYIPKIWESPVIGYGFSGFEELSLNMFGFIMNPHNVIVEVLLYGGGLALAVYIIFHYYVLLGGFQMYIKKKDFLGLILLIPYFSAFFGGQTLFTKLMWFILAFNCISLLDFNINRVKHVLI